MIDSIESPGSSGIPEELRNPEPLTARFQRLLREWKKDCKFQSAAEELFIHPSYQQIIGMGPQAVPLLLMELKRKPELLFWALHSITGEDPVPEDAKGNLRQMSEHWLKWGAKKGYVPTP